MLRNLARREGPRLSSILPVPQTTNWPWGKLVATIRANISEHFFDAGWTERAFERAKACLARIRWQRFVTVLASRAQGERLEDVEILVSDALLASHIFF